MQETSSAKNYCLLCEKEIVGAYEAVQKEGKWYTQHRECRIYLEDKQAMEEFIEEFEDWSKSIK